MIAVNVFLKHNS